MILTGLWTTTVSTSDNDSTFQVFSLQSGGENMDLVLLLWLLPLSHINVKYAMVLSEGGSL